MSIEDCVLFGKLVKTHGVKGQVILESKYNLEDKDFRESIFVEIDGILVPFFIKTIDVKSRNRYLLMLDLVTFKDAEQIVGHDVYIDKNHAIINDELDLDSLVNCVVLDQQLGEIGKCSRIDNFSGNLVLVVDSNSEEILIPFADEFVLEIMTEENYILLNLPEGLVDLNK